MGFKEQRGKAVSRYQSDRRKKNVKRVKEWLLCNPNGQQKACAKDLNLSTTTVSSISKEIEKSKEGES